MHSSLEVAAYFASLLQYQYTICGVLLCSLTTRTDWIKVQSKAFLFLSFLKKWLLKSLMYSRRHGKKISTLEDVCLNFVRALCDSDHRRWEHHATASEEAYASLCTSFVWQWSQSTRQQADINGGFEVMCARAMLSTAEIRKSWKQNFHSGWVMTWTVIEWQARAIMPGQDWA